jgi:hypothetical protein
MIAGAVPYWAVFQILDNLLVYNQLGILCVWVSRDYPYEIGGSRATGGGFQPLLPDGAEEAHYLPNKIKADRCKSVFLLHCAPFGV